MPQKIKSTRGDLTKIKLSIRKAIVNAFHRKFMLGREEEDAGGDEGEGSPFFRSFSRKKN